MDSFVETSIKALREKIGDGKVLCALSGGVDSSVAAVLLSKATSGMVTLSDQAANNADCNADGELGMDDTMVLLRFLVHFINVLPTTE